MKKLIYKGSIGGGLCAKVLLDFNDGSSSVVFPSTNEPYIVITIGSEYDSWVDVYDGILHEIMEMHMMDMELAYQRLYRAGCDTGDVWFRMPHAEYSEAISRTAGTILCFVDKAEKEYKAFKRNSKKKPQKPQPKPKEEEKPTKSKKKN